MLSLHPLSGTTAADVGAVADYPREALAQAKALERITKLEQNHEIRNDPTDPTEIPPPAARGRLRGLSELPLVQQQIRGAVLLPIDVRGHVENGPGQPNPGLRRRAASGGIEDYYAQGVDGAPSTWMGAGAAALGLAGPVDRSDMINALQGLDPAGRALVQGAGPARRYGTDLTFSAPKSVSLIWALGDEKTRAAVEAAQRAAVAETIKYIEAELALARRGKGGQERERARLVSACFQHGTSREQDMDLHTHTLVMNLGQRADGSWGAIEFGDVFKNKMLLGAVYRAALAERIQQMGFLIEPDQKNAFRIAGTPQEVEREFSRRRQQIEQALAEAGQVGGKAAEIANKDTRRGKELADAPTLHGQWQERAQALGYRRASIEALQTYTQAAEPDPARVLTGLTENESVFDERALRWATMVAAGQSGRGIDFARALEAACRAQFAVALRARDGSLRYTTREILEIEKGVVAAGKRMAASQAESIPPANVAAAIEKFEARVGFQLYDEQRLAIEYMMAGGSLKPIQGDAGAGKTTIADAARMAWENAGFRVLGCSLGGKAASGLQREAGIESSTLDSLLMRLDKGAETLDAKTVIVMDEAGTTGARHMARLLEHIERAGARLVLVGDTKQLAAVSAGTPFRDLQKSGREVFHLKQNNRQIVEKLERVQALIGEGKTGAARQMLARHGLKINDVPQALAEARGTRSAVADAAASNVAAALKKLVQRGNIQIKSTDQALAAVVEKWAARGGELRPQETLMLASTRASVARLNEAALKRLREKNFLGPTITTTVRDRDGNSLGPREFSEGSRIIFKKNDRALGVMNGELGTITRIESGKNGPILSIKTDAGKRVEIQPGAPPPADWRAAKTAPGLGYANIEHGYALTIHAAQGVTVDRAVGYVDGSMASRELSYVELSRSRISTDLVFSADAVARQEAALDLEPPIEEADLERIEKIISRMEKAAEKSSSLDYTEVALAQTVDVDNNLISEAPHADASLEADQQVEHELE